MEKRGLGSCTGNYVNTECESAGQLDKFKGLFKIVGHSLMFRGHRSTGFQLVYQSIPELTGFVKRKEMSPRLARLAGHVKNN